MGSPWVIGVALLRFMENKMYKIWVGNGIEVDQKKTGMSQKGQEAPLQNTE